MENASKRGNIPVRRPCQNAMYRVAFRIQERAVTKAAEFRRAYFPEEALTRPMK